MRELGRSFFAERSLKVAPRLLGKHIVVDGRVSGRIVEVEAYEGADDPASHGHRGRTARTEVMYGPPGHLYVYFIYGMHWCANVVCGPSGVCSAVLLRAVEPVDGIPIMRKRRVGRPDLELANGPAKLCAAFGIDGEDNGADLTAGRVRLYDDGSPAPVFEATARIGISRAKERPWRFVAAVR